MEWNQFCNKVKEVAGKTADKINQTADLASLQVKLSVAEHKLADAYEALGRVAYRHFCEDENTADAVAEAMTAVAAAQKDVDDLKDQIEKKKNETV